MTRRVIPIALHRSRPSEEALARTPTTTALIGTALILLHLASLALALAWF